MQQLVVAVRCSAIAYTLMSLQLICVALHGNAGMVIRAGHHNWPIWFRPTDIQLVGLRFRGCGCIRRGHLGCLRRSLPATYEASHQLHVLACDGWLLRLLPHLHRRTSALAVSCLRVCHNRCRGNVCDESVRRPPKPAVHLRADYDCTLLSPFEALPGV